ncbi:MAG: hypothetical protein AAGF29_04660 [Pseudomonadota bacterium]
MDHIEQLKKIRADALNRLRMSEDFRLAGKLGQLLAELGSPVDDNVMPAATTAPTSPSTSTAAMMRPPLSVPKDGDKDDSLEDKLAEELDAALDTGDDDKAPVPFLARNKDDKSAKAS